MKKNQLRATLPYILKCVSACLLFLLLFALKSNASHFRSSNITWTKGTNDTVIFNITQGWRWSAYGNPALGTLVSVGSFTFGDGSSAALNLTVNSINSPEDWLVGSATIKHKYTAVGTTFTAGYSSCCRISTLRDGNNDQNEFTMVSVQPYGTNNPPVCLVPPIINLPLNVATTYNLPGFDPEGNSFTYAITPTASSGLVVAAPSGFTLSSAGVIHWTPTINGLYGMNITVTDQFGASSNIDFILQVSSTSINPPVFDYSSGQTPVNNQVFTVNPGSTLSFNIKATDIDPGNTVSLFVTGLPPTGPTFSPALPANGNPASTTFTWTPTAANVGAHVLAIQASDNTGGQTVTNVVINVPSVAPPVFDVPPTPVAGTGTCVLVGDTLSQIVQAQNTAAGVNTKISSMSGLPAGATTSPALPTTLAAIATTTLNWAPLAEDWGPNTVTFVATDANLSTTNHSFDVLVNSSPVITSSMPLGSASVGTLYTHNFTGTDANIPYGDFLTYEQVGLPTWLTLNDNGDGTASISGTPTCSDLGVYTFDIMLEDYYHHCGPHIEQTITITVSDTQAPTISCNSPIVVSNDAGLCGAYVNFSNPVGVDNCTGATTTQTEGLPSGSLFPIGITTNKFVVTDAAGLKDSCTFTVTVNDTTAPIINCTSNVSVNNDLGFCSAIVNYSLPTVSTSCPCVLPNAVPGYTLLGDFNGHRYFKSTTTATWKNAHANALALGGHLVTIDDSAENTFLIPLGEGWVGIIDSLNEGTFTKITGSLATYTNWAVGEPNNLGNEDFVQFYPSGLWNDLPNTSLLPYVVEFDCSPILISGGVSGTRFPTGTNPVTYQLIKPNGLSTTCTFNVVVNDTELPSIICPADTTIFAAPGQCSANLNFSNTPYYSVNDIAFAPITDTGTVVTLGDDQMSTALPVGFAFNFYGQLYNQFYISSNGFITFSGGQNSGCCNGQFIPNISNPNNLIAGIWTDLAPNNGGVISYFTTGTAPNRKLVVNYSNVPHYSTGVIVDFQIVLVESINAVDIFIASLPSETPHNKTQGLENIDGTLAIAVPGRNSSNVWTVTNDGKRFLPGVFASASDNCSATITNNAPSSFSVGTTNVTWTATDPSGNSVSCISHVTVVDNQLPTITCPAPIETCNPVVTYSASANDNCGIASINYSIPSGSTFPVGITDVKVIAIDVNGNKDSCTFQVNIKATSTGSSNVEACNTYTWIENSNATYTVSGNYTQTYTNSVGCDSVHTLNLIIHYPSLTTNNISIQGCYTWSVNSTTYTTSGTYTANFTDMYGCDSNFVLNLIITPGVYLNAKAFLAGPYNSATGLMNDNLRLNGLIPLIEPYTSAPYNKTPIGESSGEATTNSVLNITGANAIVDWVMVELRSAANSSTILANKRALIQRDGDIVSTDGVSPVYFATVPNGSYFVSIKHRNHLGIMTPVAMSFSGCSTASYDFSTSSVYINPSLSLAPRKVIGSIYAMWSGDANNNKNVKYNGLSNDKDQILNAVGVSTPNNSVSPVYRVEDLNLDGMIRYNNTDNDRIIIITNVGTTTQNNIINQHTPN